MKNAARYELSENPTFGEGTSFSILKVDDDDMTGALVAWDPVAQKQVWKVQHMRMWNGGTLSLAGGLVFQGDAEGHFAAYDAREGKKLWDFDAGLGIIGAPIAYIADGRQYVSVLVGFGGATAIQGQFLKTGWKYGAQPRRVLTFAIDAKGKLPETPPPDFSIAALDDPALKIDPSMAATGAALFNQKACVICHGLNLESPGVPAPDLRESAIAVNFENFSELLKSGMLMENGMPKYDELTVEEARAIHMYIRSEARKAIEAKVTDR